MILDTSDSSDDEKSAVGSKKSKLKIVDVVIYVVFDGIEKFCLIFRWLKMMNSLPEKKKNKKNKRMNQLKQALKEFERKKPPVLNE